MLGDLFALSVLCHKGRKKCANKHLQVALGLQSTLKKKPVSLTLLTYRATICGKGGNRNNEASPVVWWEPSFCAPQHFTVHKALLPLHLARSGHRAKKLFAVHMPS